MSAREVIAATAQDGTHLEAYETKMLTHGNGWRLALFPEEVELVNRGILTREDILPFCMRGSDSKIPASREPG